MTKMNSDSAQVRLPPPLLFVGGLAGGLAIDWLLGLDLGAGTRFRWIFGALFTAAGSALLLAAAGLFRRAGTALPPWEATTTIVTDGIYRWTRNPMYLGMALIQAGLAIGLNSLTALLVLPLVLILVQTQVIAREERYLESKFGATYLSYKARVRRWL